jgi:N-acylglucosamine 2-epimerase
MILLNTGQEVGRALARAGDPRAREVGGFCARTAGFILDTFVHDGRVLEFVDPDGQPVDSILGSFINPGHTMESMWFIIHQAEADRQPETARRAAALGLAAFDAGWDAVYGGVFQYLHRAGGPPRGAETGLEDAPMLPKLRENWDHKLWWPHSEALYFLALAGQVTGEPRCAEYWARAHDYIFAVFPHPDRRIGEWIQIRDRRGAPIDKITALPVKDPFHIARNLILLVERLDGNPDQNK